MIAYSPKIGPVSIGCFFDERHSSQIDITENPIESGANVNDHSYFLPKKLSLTIGDSNPVLTYQALVAFQRSRIPFVIVTGLTVYFNMMIKDISVERDKKNSKILYGTVDLQEVIIVRTSSTSVDVDTLGENSPAQPGSPNSVRSATPSPEYSGDSITADRVSGTVQRGDSQSVTMPASSTQSILSSALFPKP